jgi:hypothetical protein
VYLLRGVHHLEACDIYRVTHSLFSNLFVSDHLSGSRYSINSNSTVKLLPLENHLAGARPKNLLCLVRRRLSEDECIFFVNRNLTCDVSLGLLLYRIYMATGEIVRRENARSSLGFHETKLPQHLNGQVLLTRGNILVSNDCLL